MLSIAKGLNCSRKMISCIAIYQVKKIDHLVFKVFNFKKAELFHSNYFLYCNLQGTNIDLLEQTLISWNKHWSPGLDWNPLSDVYLEWNHNKGNLTKIITISMICTTITLITADCVCKSWRVSKLMSFSVNIVKLEFISTKWTEYPPTVCKHCLKITQMNGLEKDLVPK